MRIRRFRWVAGGTAGLALAVLAAAVVLLRQHRRPADPAGAWPEWPAPPAIFVTDIAVSEATHDRFASDVKGSLIRGIRISDWEAAKGGLTGEFRAWFPVPEGGDRVADGTLDIREFDPSKNSELGAREFLNAIRGFQQGWVSVERTTWRTFEFRLHPGGDRANFSAHFQIAGPRREGGRADLQAVVGGEALLENGKWKLRRLGLREGCLVVNPSTPFQSFAVASGFSFLESPENVAASQAIIDARMVKTAGGLSCFDANGDGFWDFLATMVNRQSVLFLNDGHGGFIRCPGPGSRQEDAGYFFLVVDLDGDGGLEAISTQVTDYTQSDARIPIFSLRDGRWVPAAATARIPIAPGIRDLLPQAIVPQDVDRDGRLDFFYGVYSCNLSGKEKFNAVSAYDGCDNFLLLNKGGLSFVEESDARGIHGTQYCLAAAFFDFDGDGDQDLFECNDFGPNILWLNDGSGSFKESPDSRLAVDPAYTMGVTIGDWDNTGEWSIYISNMYSHAGNRIVPLAQGLSREMSEKGRVLAHGNQLFERSGGEKNWRETSLERRVNWADWAWSCQFFDADNDGDKEIYVANGYTSNKDPAAPDW